MIAITVIIDEGLRKLNMANLRTYLPISRFMRTAYI